MVRIIVCLLFFVLGLIMCVFANMIPYKSVMYNGEVLISADGILIVMVILFLGILIDVVGFFLSIGKLPKILSALLLVISGYCLYQVYLETVIYKVF